MIAHSQGTAIAFKARQLLTPAERARVNYIGLGSQTYISVPGQIFSSSGQFQNCFRLSYGTPWSDKIERGLKTLGEIVKTL